MVVIRCHDCHCSLPASSMQDEDGLTPMMFAARFGRYSTLKALIEGQGSRQVLRMTDKRNVSCMGHAAASRNQECVSLLMTGMFPLDYYLCALVLD